MKTVNLANTEPVYVRKGRKFLKSFTKGRYLFIAFLTLLLINIFLASCEDDSMEIYGDYAVIERTDPTCVLKTDQGAVLLPSNLRISSGYLEDNDRVIVSFTVLEEAKEADDYDYCVEVIDIYKILTKDVIPYSINISDSLGTDPVELDEPWIKNGYITLDFFFAGGQPGLKHMVNLTQYPEKTEDDRILLEFRHNAFQDNYSYKYHGIVAFPTSSIQTSVSDSVRLRIKYTDFDKEKYYDLTWYKTQAPKNILHSMGRNTYETGNFR